MAADIGIDDPFYNDRPMFFVGYYKNWIIALYTISTVSGGMMACNTMDMYFNTREFIYSRSIRNGG